MSKYLSRKEVDRLIKRDVVPPRRLIRDDEVKLLQKGIKEYLEENNLSQSELTFQNTYDIADALGIKDFVLYDQEANPIPREKNH